LKIHENAFYFFERVNSRFWKAHSASNWLLGLERKIATEFASPQIHIFYIIDAEGDESKLVRVPEHIYNNDKRTRADFPSIEELPFSF